MFKHKSRILFRHALSMLIASSFVLSGTTFGVAADLNSQDKTIQTMFALPADREQTPENIDLVNKHLVDGRKYYAKGDFEKAISKFQEAYGLAKEIKYADGEGKSLIEMCRYYHGKGQLPRAKSLGENALEVLAEASDKKSLGFARVALAQVYISMDNTNWALTQLQAAMKDFIDIGSNDSYEASQVLLIAGQLAVKLGYIKEALQFYEAAATYLGQANDYPRAQNLYLKIAGTLLQGGAASAALEEANKALALAKNSKSPEQLKAALSCVANCQYNLGEFWNARKTYEQMLAIKLKDENPITTAIVEEGYGFALAATGDSDAAKVCLDRALNVIKLKAPAIHRAQTCNALGIIATIQGNHTEALQHLRQALESVSIISPRPERFYTVVLQNLAAAEARAGENRNAKNHVRLAIQAASTKKFNDATLVGRAYTSLAEICLNLKEFPEAEAALKRGMEISGSVNDDSALWRDYALQAKLNLATNLPPEEALTGAVSFFRSPQAGDFPTLEAFYYPSTRAEQAQELVSQLVSVGFLEQALLTAEQLKEESVINDWHRRGGEVRKADQDIYDDLVLQRTHLHAAENTSAPKVMLEEWKKWLGRFNALARENPSLARLISPIPINLQELVKSLQSSRMTVVDYLVCKNSTIVFILDSNGRISANTIGVGKEELQSQVTQLLTASEKNPDNSAAVEKRMLQLLYNELIAEHVQKFLPKDPEKTVVIIPDGILFNLPFAALIDAQGKYMVEDHTLTMAPSVSYLVNNQPRHKDISMMMAIAGSDGNETHAICAAFDPGQVTKVENGDAASLQEQSKTSGILHFTSNFNIPVNNPLRSVLQLSMQNTPNTGVTASSLFSLKLPSDLAVLSGSAVNARDYRGDAVQVFSRGLSYAGVRNVLMSLWLQPEVQRTNELIDFYRNQQQGLNEAQSLRKAQLLALSKDPSPRSWAAFQLIGPGN